MLSTERSRFYVKPLVAKRLRHDFAELPIEITLASTARKVNDTALVEHIEPVLFQFGSSNLRTFALIKTSGTSLQREPATA